MFVGSPAEADFQAAGSAVLHALAAYGHYLGLVLVVGALTTERLSAKACMTDKEEELVYNAGIVYGLAGTLLLYTGYLRVAEYGKGWGFYNHSPVFWMKMLLFATMGSSSLFPTIKIVQHLTTIMNGELLAVGSIPLAVALMSRGVAYNDALSWQAGVAPVARATVGLDTKHVKDALDWTEDEE